jgi:hypothetical protein
MKFIMILDYYFSYRHMSVDSTTVSIHTFIYPQKPLLSWLNVRR